MTSTPEFEEYKGGRNLVIGDEPARDKHNHVVTSCRLTRLGESEHKHAFNFYYLLENARTKVSDTKTLPIRGLICGIRKEVSKKKNSITYEIERQKIIHHLSMSHHEVAAIEEEFGSIDALINILLVGWLFNVKQRHHNWGCDVFLNVV